jgi:uncharacterized RDD family membrane protein YckC
MSDPATSGPAETPPPRPMKRAGFWRRAAAFVLDLLLLNMLVAAIGLAATALTGGSVRVASAVDDVRRCGAWQPIPPELSVPSEFAGGDMRRCTRSVYGFDYDRTLVVREAASSYIAETDRKQITITLDADGRPVRTFYIDSLTPLVLAVYLLLLERRYGATPGKWILGIEVVTLDGEPIDFWQAGKRAVIRALVVLCSGETQVGLRMTTAYVLSDLGLWSQIINLSALLYLIAFAIATSGGALSLHDRWAGTQVVLTRQRSASAGSENRG